MPAPMLRTTCALLLTLLVSSVWASPVQREIRVNCDRGDDLGAVLRRVGKGRAVIHLTGTCQGPVFVTGEVIELVGRSPAESQIVGGSGNAALYVRGPGQVVLRNLGISSAHAGIDVEGPGRGVAVEDCEIFDNWHGILANQGAHVGVRRSQVHSNPGWGVQAGAGSDVLVVEGAIRDNGEGARLFQSTLLLEDTEVRGHSVLGVLAENLSTARVLRTTFLENGQGHLGVTDRSSLVLVDSTVGQAGDTTPLSLFAGADSRLEVYSQSAGAIYGDALAVTGSNLSIQGATLHAGVTLQDFSWIKLTGATVDGTIECQTGSDAICAAGSSAVVSGCGAVAASCNGASAPALEPPALLKPLPAERRYSRPVPSGREVIPDGSGPD